MRGGDPKRVVGAPSSLTLHAQHTQRGGAHPPVGVEPVLRAPSSLSPTQSLASHQLSSHATSPSAVHPRSVVSSLRNPEGPSSNSVRFSHLRFNVWVS